MILSGTAALIALMVTMVWAVGGRTPAPATAAAAAAQTSTPAGVTVSAVGEMSGTPDALRLLMSLTTTGDTVDAALAQANAVTTKVFDTLKAQGVKESDLQTANLSIQQNYDDKGKATGYQVTESLTAVLRDLKTAGASITQAVAAGGNATRVDSLSTDLSDNGALMTSARERAFAEAKKKAEQYASAAGRPLGAVQSISESVDAPNFDLRDSARVGVAGSVPIEAGTQQASVTVTVTFAFA